MGHISFGIVKIWLILLLGLVYLEEMPVSANRCTIVKDFKVVRGDSAELYCQINHTSNDPSKTDVYSKTWTKHVTGSVNENVYVLILRNAGNDTVKDEASNNYKSRAKRIDNDIVTLSNITDADDGTYGCQWSVAPDIPECSADNEGEFTLSVIGNTNLSSEAASAVSGPERTYTISGQAVGDDLSTSDVDWKIQVNASGTISNATYNVAKTVINSRSTTVRKTVTAVATVVCPCSTEVINILQVTHPARDGRIIEAQPVIVKCGNCSECCTSTSAPGTDSTTVDGRNNDQTIYVPAVTLLVLACVLFIASVVVIVLVMKLFFKCKKENDGFSPKLWLFVVFAVVAIIIAITFIAVGSVYLHSEGSPAVSVGLGLCIPFLIMDVFFIIGFVKHMIKGPLVAPFCSTTKKDVTSNGTKAESAASRDNSAVKKDRATPQQISLQGNPEKGGNFNLTDEEKGSNPQFPPIDSTKMIHTDKPRKLPPLPASHLPPLDEANTTPRKKKKKKAKRKSQEDEE